MGIVDLIQAHCHRWQDSQLLHWALEQVISSNTIKFIHSDLFLFVPISSWHSTTVKIMTLTNGDHCQPSVSNASMSSLFSKFQTFCPHFQGHSKLHCSLLIRSWLLACNIPNILHSANDNRLLYISFIACFVPFLWCPLSLGFLH